IGIDCRTILNPGAGEHAGVGHYTYYLVKNLLKLDQKNQYILFFDSRFKDAKEFESENVKIVHFPFYEYKKFLPVVYSQMLVSSVLKREKLDVFHSPANIVPMFYNLPSVVTVHDLAIYKYPHFFPKSFMSRQAFSTKVLMPETMVKASKIIAVSRNTKSDIIEQFNVEPEKVAIVYEGVVSHGPNCPNQANFVDTKIKYGLADKYILFLGTIEPRKNINGLVKAFMDLRLVHDSPIKNYQLIIAGAPGWYYDDVFTAICDANTAIMGKKYESLVCNKVTKRRSKKHPAWTPEQLIDCRLETPIKYLGYLPFAEKLAVLCHSSCLVFPSLYEGFGLPVLEAMSMGVPVITSNTSSLPEVTGKNGAVFIDPNQESSIVDALQRLLTDPGLAEELSVLGQNRARELSWEKCAEETLAIYQGVVNKKV
ncbi:MAG: glycosyltransferase family 1 protein, partial [bacterium]